MKSIKEVLNVRKLNENATRFITKDVWKTEPVGTGRRMIFDTIRYFIMVFRGFMDDHCFLRATALSYTTALSIVPVTAVVFAFLGAIGSFQAYEERIMNFALDQLIPQTGVQEQDDETKEDFAEKIKTFIAEKRQALKGQSAGLGAVGVGFVIFTLISVMATIEKSFNAIWGVKKGRPYLQRVVYYWFLTFVPIMVVVSIAVGVSVTSSSAVQWMQTLPVVRGILQSPITVFLIARVTPLVIMWIAFAALYMFMPNTRVRLPAALKGGLWAAALFELAKNGSIFVLSGKAAKFGVLYGALAAVPLFLFWVYVIWLIVLFGAEMSFASQNIKTYSRERRVEDAGQAIRESIAIRVFTLVAQRFHHAQPALTATQLSDAFDIPIRLVMELCAQMSEARIMTECHDVDISYQPGRDLDKITPKDVIDCLRRGADKGLEGIIRPEDRAVVDLFNRGESAAAQVFASATFKQIVEQLNQAEQEEEEKTPPAAPAAS
ncbi:MAG: YihY/virulence factor BrkB family protein [Planctomycetes bacterium]|nr:YihY/virulence factor BrkB family protein [Planctomycetota bacterium]